MPFIGGGPLSPSGFRRRGRRRGLLAGGAIGAGIMHHFDKKNAEEAEQEEAQAYAAQEQQYAPTGQYPPPAQYASPQQQAPAIESTESLELEQLAKLHEEGILTDEEFAAKKQQILGL